MDIAACAFWLGHSSLLPPCLCSASRNALKAFANRHSGTASENDGCRQQKQKLLPQSKHMVPGRSLVVTSPAVQPVRAVPMVETRHVFYNGHVNKKLCVETIFHNGSVLK